MGKQTRRENVAEMYSFFISRRSRAVLLRHSESNAAFTSLAFQIQMSLDNQTSWNWSHHHHHDGPSLQTRLAFASAWIFIAVAGVIGEDARDRFTSDTSFRRFQEILW